MKERLQTAATGLTITLSILIMFTPLWFEYPERLVVIAVLAAGALLAGLYAVEMIPYNLGITLRFGEREDQELRQLRDELANGSTDPDKWNRYVVLNERRRR